MVSTKKSVVVEQHTDTDATLRKCGGSQPKPADFIYRYEVLSLRNLTRPVCGQRLSESEVQGLIDQGVEVTVK